MADEPKPFHAKMERDFLCIETRDAIDRLVRLAIPTLSIVAISTVAGSDCIVIEMEKGAGKHPPIKASDLKDARIADCFETALMFVMNSHPTEEPNG